MLETDRYANKNAKGTPKMTVVDKIASLARTLPKEAQEQVLDFVGFLVSKYDAETPSEDEAWDQVESQVSPGRRQPGR